MKPSSARCAVASRGEPHAARRRAEHDHAAGGSHARGPSGGRSAAARRARVESAMPGGVEDERLEALVGRRLGVEHGGVEPGRGGVRAHRVVERASPRRRPRRPAPARRPRPRGPAPPSSTRPRHRSPGVALELDRLRQPDPLGDGRRDRRVDELRVAVAHRARLLQDRDDALAAGGADADHAAARRRARAAPWPAPATIRPPVAANGWPAASEPPLTLSLSRSIAPSGASRPSRSLAEHRVLPRLQRAEHLRGERLVDLVEVEVLQRRARCGRACRGIA